MTISMASSPPSNQHPVEATFVAGGYEPGIAFVIRCPWCRRLFGNVVFTDGYPTHRISPELHAAIDRALVASESYPCDPPDLRSIDGKDAT